ncbi:glycosyltransferase family 2 protein [Scleroderma citrinum Foug A]|uniref:Glycosyltransferase family 2 protein n=1 Tax=Scleroderma citrinum Foug A TaxID=1036808 RepID=A0A0C3CVV4_9AGAM|nr:glycosyltransferase family 2 protein [Scleroderma citrinum Foug A]
MVDADGASRFEDLEQLWANMDEIAPQNEAARSLLRNILMYGLHTILRIVGKIFPAQHLATWIFDVELLLLAKQLSIPVAEVPIELHEVAGSKLNIVKDSLQMLRDLMVLRGNQLVGRWKAASS